MVLRRVLLFLGSIVILCVPFVAQTPFSFSVNSRLVIQTVSVTDNDGRPIEGLTKDDFVLTEDNVPQVISVFEFQKIDDTVSPGQTPALEQRPLLPADTNQIAPVPPQDNRYQDRRLLAFYFDMKAMSDADRLRTHAAAYKFVTKEMTDADVLAIFTYSDAGLRVRHDFTDDKETLLEVLDRVFDEDAFEEPNFDFGQGEFNLFNTDRKLSAIQRAVNMLGVLREKKSVIYFSSGFGLNGVDNQAQYRATVNAARRANVSFYPVDSRGLVALPPMGDASRPSPGGIGMYTGATAMATLRTFRNSQDGIYTLAADTGGKAFLDYNDLSGGIVAAQRANSSYYLLGYYSSNTAKDGKLRRVKITLRNRSARLVYRDSYYADKEFSKFNTYDKEHQLEEALLLGDPITELTIAMELNYFQLNRAEYFVPLAVKIPGEELVLAQKAGAEKTVIDFLGEVRNEYGIVHSNIRDKVEIPLKGEMASVLANRHVQYDAGFTLLPGNYVIKFLARNTDTGRIGTYQASFTIPNLNKEVVRLPISSVVLGSQRIPMTDAVYNAGKNKEARAQVAHPLIDGGMKLIPSVTRVFSRTRDFYIYLQAYERDALSTEPLIVLVKFFREGESPIEVPASIVKDGLDPNSKAVPLKLTVSLDRLTPGEYTCHVSVLDTTTQKVAFWQTSIRVVP